MRISAILRFKRLRFGNFSFRQRSKSHEEIDIYDYVFSIDTSSPCAESGQLTNGRGIQLLRHYDKHWNQGVVLVALKRLSPDREVWRRSKRREKGVI